MRIPVVQLRRKLLEVERVRDKAFKDLTPLCGPHLLIKQ